MLERFRRTKNPRQPRAYNTIQRPDLMLRIQQYFGIRQQSTAPTLAPDVVAVAVVADLTKPVGDRRLQGDPNNPVLCSAATTLGAQVGFFNSAKIRNPATSGVVLRIRFLTFFSGGGSFYACGYILNDSTDLPDGNLAPLVVDTTFKPPNTVVNNISPRAVTSYRNTSAVAIAGTQQFALIGGNSVTGIQAMYPSPFAVIAPGDSFTFETSAVNTPMTVTVGWEEVPISA